MKVASSQRVSYGGAEDKLFAKLSWSPVRSQREFHKASTFILYKFIMPGHQRGEFAASVHTV